MGQHITMWATSYVKTGRRANMGSLSVSYFETKHKWAQDDFYFIFTLLY